MSIMLLGMLAAVVVAFLIGYNVGLHTCRKEKNDLLDG